MGIKPRPMTLEIARSIIFEEGRSYVSGSRSFTVHIGDFFALDQPNPKTVYKATQVFEGIPMQGNTVLYDRGVGLKILCPH